MALYLDCSRVTKLATKKQVQHFIQTSSMKASMPAYSLADTWLLNNRVNLRLLEQLSDAQLAWASNPRARSVAGQFAHLHSVRLMWLEVVAPAAAPMAKIEKGAASAPALRAALEASALALGTAIAEAEQTGRMRGYKRGVAAFVGYLLAHEAHHRGQIVLHLKYAKMALAPKAGYDLWEWEKI
jgi:uncharacterized damage-inducible protein DinB